jgi:hypothetical protein
MGCACSTRSEGPDSGPVRIRLHRSPELRSAPKHLRDAFASAESIWIASTYLMVAVTIASTSQLQLRSSPRITTISL